MRVGKVLLVAFTCGAAACNSSGVESGDPLEEPESTTACSVTWVTEAPASRFTLSMPIESWTTGAHTFSVDAPGVLEIASGTYRVADGTFELATTGPIEGSAVSFQDTSTHTLLDIAGASAGLMGAGGTGRFDGTWHFGDDAVSPPGSGTLFAVVESVCFDVGMSRSTATCLSN